MRKRYCLYLGISLFILSSCTINTDNAFKSKRVSLRNESEDTVAVEEATSEEDTAVASNSNQKKKKKKSSNSSKKSNSKTSASKSNDTEVVNEQSQEEETEDASSVVMPDSFTDSGTVKHLLEVANDPNASTTMDEGVTYMFMNDDNGERIMGSVMAYYTNLSNLDTTDLSSFCKSFIENYIPEVYPYYDKAEEHGEDGTFGVTLDTDICKLALMPDRDCEGITVVIGEP